MDGVKVLALGKLTGSAGESTFSIKDWAVFAVAASVQADEHQIQHIAELWRGLPSGGQARCHVPPFALRFYASDEMFLEASLCWHCNNIWLREEKAFSVFEFDGRAEASQELLAVLNAMTRVEETKPMTITLKPETEARLRERASRDGAELNELADTLLSNVLVDDPHRMTKSEMDASYQAMAADEEREVEAMEWAEGTLGHVFK